MPTARSNQVDYSGYRPLGHTGGGTTAPMSSVNASSSNTSSMNQEVFATAMPDNVGSLMLQQFENETVAGYRPPGTSINQNIMKNMNSNNTTSVNDSASTNITGKQMQWVHNPLDGSVLQDHRGRPVSVDRLLATKPLKDELSSRKGPGGKQLTYMSGDGVSRTLNDIFGFDGWNLDIRKVEQVGKNYDKSKDRFEVVYTAHVRVTHKISGTYREDVGCGDSIDKSYATAVGHAIKGAITDGLKRSARHFGDKLGGALYSGNVTKKNAPGSLRDSLDKYEIERANAKFGFPMDQQNAAEIVASDAAPACVGPANSSSTSSIKTNMQSSQPNQQVQQQHRHHTLHRNHRQDQSKQSTAPSVSSNGHTQLTKLTNAPSNGPTICSVHYPQNSAGDHIGNGTNIPENATNFETETAPLNTSHNNTSQPPPPCVPQIQQKQQQQPQPQQYQPVHEMQRARPQTQTSHGQDTATITAVRPQQQPNKLMSSRPPSRYGSVVGGNAQGHDDSTTIRQNPYGGSASQTHIMPIANTRPAYTPTHEQQLQHQPQQASHQTIHPHTQNTSSSNAFHPQQNQHPSKHRAPLIRIAPETSNIQSSGTSSSTGGPVQEKSISNNDNIVHGKRSAPSIAVTNPYQPTSKVVRHSM